MSKHTVHGKCWVMHDIHTMTPQELQEKYDIEIDEDASIWDNCEGKWFENLQQWGLFIEQQENEQSDTFIHNGGKHRYDDD